MSQQLITIVQPEGRVDDAPELLHQIQVIDSWQDRLEDHRANVHLLVGKQYS